MYTAERLARRFKSQSPIVHKRQALRSESVVDLEFGIRRLLHWGFVVGLFFLVGFASYSFVSSFFIFFVFPLVLLVSIRENRATSTSPELTRTMAIQFLPPTLPEPQMGEYIKEKGPQHNIKASGCVHLT